MKTPNQTAAQFLRTLTAEQIAYAIAPERGEFRGFAALHELFDANECLADLASVRDLDGGPEAVTAFYNSAIAQINSGLLS